jgi:uncharacterized protein YdeI (YjbR/CyaY-like superfamily)
VSKLVGQRSKEPKMSTDFSNLKRQKNLMPDFVIKAIEERGLMNAFNERPAYQQNDYIGWINRAKRQETKLKRLQQMLDELSKGGVYMNMRHPASKKEAQ